jgi:outer membrane cobalamin receptor
VIAASGSQLPRIVVLVDGKIACTGPCDLLTALAVMEIESVEIVRGAAVLKLYGEAARDGAISIRTKRGRS